MNPSVIYVKNTHITLYFFLPFNFSPSLPLSFFFLAFYFHSLLLEGLYPWKMRKKLVNFTIIILNNFLLSFASAFREHSSESWSIGDIESDDDSESDRAIELTPNDLYDPNSEQQYYNIMHWEHADYFEQIRSKWTRHESSRAAQPDPPELPEGIVTGTMTGESLTEGSIEFAGGTLKIGSSTFGGESYDAFTGMLDSKSPDQHRTMVHVRAFPNVEYLRGFLHVQKKMGSSHRLILEPLALVHIPGIEKGSLVITKFHTNLRREMRNADIYTLTLIMADVLEAVNQMHEKGIYRPSLIFDDMGIINDELKLTNFDKTTDELFVKDVGYLLYGSHGKLSSSSSFLFFHV